MSDVGAPRRAVLDTDVIFSRVLYELFGRIGSELRLLDIIWSDELLADCRQRLHAAGSVTSAKRSQRVEWIYRRFHLPFGSGR